MHPIESKKKMARPKSKITKQRVNMTLAPKVVEFARENANSEGYRSLSELVETLLEAHNIAVNGERKTLEEAKGERAIKSAAKRNHEEKS